MITLTAVLVGNKSNPFDEGSDEDDEEDSSDELKGDNALSRILTRGQGRGGKKPDEGSDSDACKALQSVKDYASSPSKYERTPAQNKQVEAFVAEVGGWGLADVSVADLAGGGVEVRLLSLKM